MKTSQHRAAALAQIAADVRHALTPSLPAAEKPQADRIRDLLDRAQAMRILADCHARAGEVAMAASYVAQGRALCRELREMEG